MGNVIEFEIEPDDPKKPGQINLRITTPRDHADYVERRLTAVGYGIYLGGCHLYCTKLSMPVFLPDSDIDFTAAKATAINDTIYADRASADKALRAAPTPAGGPARYAYYWGAGGALVVPTVFSPATTPCTIQTLLTARQLLAKDVEQQLTILALTMVGGAVLKTLAARLVRVGQGKAEPRAGSPPRPPLDPAEERLLSTQSNLLNQEVVRSGTVLTRPQVFRHTLTADVPAVSYARIEQEGCLRLSTGAKAHYGEGVYAWQAGAKGVGTYIDIQVAPGTAVETIQVKGQTFVRLLPAKGNSLPVKIVGTNMSPQQIAFGRKVLGKP